MKPAILLYGASDRNQDMFYSTKYSSPSSFILAFVNDVKYMIVPRSEFSDAKKKSSANDVFSFDDFLSSRDYADIEKRNDSTPTRMGYVSEVANLFLKQRGVKQVLVPQDFPFKIAQALKWRGFAVKIDDSVPFFKQRLVKTEDELNAIKKSIAAAELVLANVVDMVKNAEIHRDVLHHEGIPITSESLRDFIRIHLYENDFIINYPIVSSGFDTASPHKEGVGPLKVDQPILFDIFPKSLKSGYFADISRTFVRGKPSAEIKKMHSAILKAQELAISMVREDMRVSSLYNAVLDLFKSHGFNTDDEKNFGFVHSLGHGVGLDIHESPNISDNDFLLKAGNVITIEPGLYYPTLGGVRIEDMILVKKNSCEVLTSYPKKLEL